MSSNTNFTCRETYYSYGSYLRSRGYDKEICNLVAAIEAGQIKIGPITPGSCPSAPTTINNSVTINGCPSGPTSTTGILKVTGGNIGPANVDTSGTITSFLSGSTNFGIQSSTGIRNLGPIYSSTDCNRSNYFGAANHIFAGGSSGDCSANVLIRGNLLVDGSTVDIGGFIGETLTLTTLAGNTALGTLNLFRSPLANGNTMTVYNDTSDNISSGSWETGLTFSIDGNLENTTPGSGIDRIAGMTDTHGHVRSFRGITVSNPPLDGQPIDICYNRDISGSPYALQVYGDLTIDRGNNNASGNIDLSGGDINFYLNNNKTAYIHSNGDASFNGHVTIYDLSVINVMTVGTSTTYIDTNDVSTNNLKAGFVIVDNSLNTSFIYSPMVEDLTIQAGTSGTANVEFVANKVIINDLSVNDICANSINLNVAIFNNITTTDLSVNNHASIYDLSVTNLLNVGDVTITQTQVQTNTLRSTNTNPLTIQGGLGGQNIILQAGTVNMRDNVSLVTISDLSVNDISAGQIDVTNIDVSMITNSGKITTTDLSVNTHASILDLSVINLMTVGNDISLTNGTVTSTMVDCSNILVSSNAIFNNDVSINNILTVGNKIIVQDLSVNRHASIFDLSVVNFMTVGTSTTTIDTNSINATSGYFNDISVNDLSVNSLKVESLEIASQLILQDLSVNGLASIFDLSVINLMTVGTSTTTIDTNSINAISGIFDNSLNVNDNFSVNHTTGMIDFSAINVTFNNGLIIEKSSTINTIRAPFNESQQIKISTGTGGSDGSGSMIIESGKQLDLTSVGFTTITASGQGQGIDLSANGNITLTATDISFINVSNVYFGNSVVDISDLRIGSRISTDNIVNGGTDELQISSLQNGMTFTSLSGDISFHGNSANFVDMSVNMVDLSVNNIITNTIYSNNPINVISFNNNRLYDISSIIVENSIITQTVGAVNGNLNLDSSGGNIYINAGNNDISFNADTITFDASVCFLKDPFIKEAAYDNRELKIYGAATTIISLDTSGVSLGSVQDISFNNILYSDLEPVTLQNEIFDVCNNYIDFSNNQLAVSNALFEIFLSVTMTFTNQSNGITFQFEEINSRYAAIEIDTRSISRKSNPHTVCFGPQTFVFSSTSSDSSDDRLKGGIWKIVVVQDGTGAELSSDARLTIKMKSIV